MTAGPRRKSRELAMQMLYQADIGKQSAGQVRATFWKAGDEVGPDVRGFAVGEMLGFKGTPFPIVINEALEIGRRYCAPESINFLNGMLDSIARGLIGK